MNDVLMQQFIQLISTNTGLHVREQDREDLCKKIYARMKLLKLSVPEQYYQLLKTGKDQKNSHQETLHDEWRELTLLLTIGETYFFRDRGQISLFKNRILPELIARKKKEQYAAGETKRSLRLWSAGCSTGEEVYSLAILVKELIPDCDKWNILILGTDINSESIEKAKRGIYESWSFRMVNPELQKRHFYQRQTRWEVNEQIRAMVTFRSGNLIKDRFPSPTSDIHSMDMILCRNVFIYFDSNSISVVLEKFYNTLRPGGYLIAGHTELHGQNLGQMQAKIFPEAVIYQRSEEGREERKQGSRVVGAGFTQNRSEQTTSLNPPSSDRGRQKDSLYTGKAEPPKPFQAQPRQPRSLALPIKDNVKALPWFGTGARSESKENLTKTTSQTVLSQAETLFHNGAYALAITEAEQVIKQHPDHFGAYYLMGQAWANLGESEKAIHCLGQALKVDSLSVAPYYLLAHVAEEQGDIEKAKDLFKKIIYLAPSSIAAYLEVGSLYEREGDMIRARKMRETALELLKELPPHLPVEHQGEMTVCELLIHVKNLLK